MSSGQYICAILAKALKSEFIKWALCPFFVSGFLINANVLRWLMSSSSRVDALKEMLEPAVVAAGMELWGIEYMPQGKHSVLRLYIDSAKGVHVDDCVAVSHQVSGILDVEDPINGEYNLEVSSPGADRPMFSAAQYSGYEGEEFKLKLKLAVQNKRKFVGRLVSVDSDVITFAVDEEEVAVSIAQIDKANLVPRF